MKLQTVLSTPIDHDETTLDDETSCRSRLEVLDAKVVFLTHYIPLYQVRVLQEITRRVRDFRILLSTPIEPNRDFQPDWSGLNVDVQNTITLRRRWRHAAAGFDDPLFVHLPYDTLSQLKHIQPDVVISHELGARSLAASHHCRRGGAGLVLATFMSEHTEQGRGRLRRWSRRRLIRSADAITYNGPSCRDYLLAMGAEDDRLFHLPYAADDRTVSMVDTNRNESAIRHRLLCIGQLSQRKGVLPLVRQANSFCVAHDRPLEITFVGDGPLRGELQNLPAIDSRLKLNVLGNRPAAELPALMKEHGAVVAPTLADEWLLVVNEAMHAGMPVLGSIYAQAVNTLIIDDRNGWRYDPLDESSFDSVLSRYLATPDADLVTMRRNAMEDIAGYTPQRSAQGALDAVKFALDRRGATSSRVKRR